LRERLDAYEGSVTKALSAYNQGSVKVNRGSYSPRYANAVMTKYNNIIYYLNTNGYVTKQ
jgi:soluble lytic murein transglycosylase-like protein